MGRSCAGGVGTWILGREGHKIVSSNWLHRLPNVTVWEVSLSVPAPASVFEGPVTPSSQLSLRFKCDDSCEGLGTGPRTSTRSLNCCACISKESWDLAGWVCWGKAWMQDTRGPCSPCPEAGQSRGSNPGSISILPLTGCVASVQPSNPSRFPSLQMEGNDAALQAPKLRCSKAQKAPSTVLVIAIV